MENTTIRLKGYRTLLFNLAILGLAVTDYLVGFDFSIFASPRIAAVLILGITLINIILRFFTTTVIGKSQ